MRLNKLILIVVFGPAHLLGMATAGACDLKVESGWIRELPPMATSLAAYATLTNMGTKKVEITAISTGAAEMAMLHETAIKNGFSQMRMLSSLSIAAGAKVTLAPGGKHLMLTGLKGMPKAGDHVSIAFTDASGCVTEADFSVRSSTSN
jgi:copper(I)-binding protein